MAHNLPGEDDVVALAEALINIESTSGEEQHMAHSVAAWLTARGWEVTLQPVDKAYPEGVSSA
jgi:acetylornithine deacetylase/succinyl-diaminopimelate desuccinylase-like protein